MKFFRVVLIYLAMILVLGLKAFAQQPGQEMKSDAVASAQETKPGAEPAPAEGADDRVKGSEKRFVALVGKDGVQHVEIVGGEYYFDPNFIVVKVNTPVELKVKKAPGIVSHDIVVKAPEAGIDFKTDLGKEWMTVTFTPTRPGKYEMFCDKKFLWFKSHRDRGMEGSIEVVP